MEQNLISKAIEIAGLHQVATACGVTYQAVRKWEANNCLPRTEWTGETNYASKIVDLVKGAFTKEDLLRRPVVTE